MNFDEHADLPHEEYVSKYTQFHIREYPFSLSYLIGARGLRFHDAEDLLSEFYVRRIKRNAAQIKKFERGTLVAMLRNASIDFIRSKSWRNQKDSFSIEHVGDWAVPFTGKPSDFLLLVDDVNQFRLQLKMVKPRCSEQEGLVCKKMLECLDQGTRDKTSLKLFFSKSEADFLMEENGELKHYSWKAFRNKLNRLRRNIEEKIKGLSQTGDGFYFN